ETAGVVRRLGRPGIWCHGLAIRPGKPTLLADCDGVPVIGLPGNPRSALVVFRLLGIPLVRLVGGCTMPPAEPVVRARLARDLASATGRLDVVQVRVHDGTATPIFGLSALLSVLTAADGYVIVPEEATGLDAAGMDGIAVRAADTLGASETTPVYLQPGDYDVVDTGDPMPDGRDAVVMREHIHYSDRAAELRAAVPPYQHVRSIGEDVSTAE